MRTLNINFVAQTGLARRLAYLLLFMSLAAAVLMANIYVRHYRERKLLEKSWSEVKKSEYKKVALHPVAKGDEEKMKSELKSANNVINRLSLPWDVLFSEIETSMNDKVTLLSIEPDSEKREVRITAEAKNFDEVLAYVKALQAVSVLQNPYIVSHQIQIPDPQRPVRFLVSAKWLDSAVAGRD